MLAHARNISIGMARRFWRSSGRRKHLYLRRGVLGNRPVEGFSAFERHKAGPWRLGNARSRSSITRREKPIIVVNMASEKFMALFLHAFSRYGDMSRLAKYVSAAIAAMTHQLLWPDSA